MLAVKREKMCSYCDQNVVHSVESTCLRVDTCLKYNVCRPTPKIKGTLTAPLSCNTTKRALRTASHHVLQHLQPLLLYRSL